MIIENTEKPLVVQSDTTLLLDVHNPSFEKTRTDLSTYAELEKSPEHIHTYKITPLSLWNAASAGINSDIIIKSLKKWSKFELPENIIYTIDDIISRFGKIRLKPSEHKNILGLEVDDKFIRAELSANQKLKKLLLPHGNDFLINLYDRGTIKQELIKIGYPVKDEVPLKPGKPIDFSFNKTTESGFDFNIRNYQEEAAKTFHGEGRPGCGFGTIVLPCGAGKTIVGMATINLLKTSTLILTTNVAAVHQWIDELVDKTSFTRDDVGEYTGDKKLVKDITVATYQILTWRPDKDSDFPHFKIFKDYNWGLIIYDEVHLLPAPVFRVTAEIQAVRRLGLTATLIREDGREDEVFSLVGPKRYDVPWKELEAKGWIAEANCYEVRVDLLEDQKIPYAVANKRQKFRIASENPVKERIAKELVDNHKEDHIIVIGQYIDQLKKMSKLLKAPLITGQTPNSEREEIYKSFKEGKERVIVVSKVANFAIDLPDASVAIQISGSFGSRQEEAQRLGRILRPKKRNSYFYSIVSRYTTEESFSANRQKFLTEQGYKYQIDFWE